MSLQNGNSIQPQGSQFCAFVGGKPTGLAGCSRAAECPRAAQCLRADARLAYRANLAYGQPLVDCRAFIAA